MKLTRALGAIAAMTITVAALSACTLPMPSAPKASSDATAKPGSTPAAKPSSTSDRPKPSGNATGPAMTQAGLSNTNWSGEIDPGSSEVSFVLAADGTVNFLRFGEDTDLDYPGDTWVVKDGKLIITIDEIITDDQPEKPIKLVFTGTVTGERMKLNATTEIGDAELVADYKG